MSIKPIITYCGLDCRTVVSTLFPYWACDTLKISTKDLQHLAHSSFIFYSVIYIFTVSIHILSYFFIVGLTMVMTAHGFWGRVMVFGSTNVLLCSHFCKTCHFFFLFKQCWYEALCSLFIVSFIMICILLAWRSKKSRTAKPKLGYTWGALQVGESSCYRCFKLHCYAPERSSSVCYCCSSCKPGKIKEVSIFKFDKYNSTKDTGCTVSYT